MTETSPQKILLVVTSHGQLGETGEPTGFWLEEVASPYYEFTDRGYEVQLASPQGGEPPMDSKSQQEQWQTESTRRFGNDSQAVQRLKHTWPLPEVDAGNYDGIFLAGGHGTMWDFPTDPHLTKLIETFNREGKIIAAVCHGVAALVPATGEGGKPLVAGKSVTSFTDSEERQVQLEKVVPFLLETRLRELGANFQGGPDFAPRVERDGNLITGQNPASSALAAQTAIAALAEKSQ
jgi:putative intracellular protease/amidase